MNNLIGQHLGPYRILEQIGTGGMATVYKAYQPAMDRYVAVKVIASHFAQDQTFLRRFRREARAVAQLEHAHILPVYDSGEAEGRPYLVMRYLKAGTLKDRLAEGLLFLSEVNRIIGQVGSALDYAHRMGVIHRDVKPTNVLLDAEGDTFLTDFGLAKMVASSVQLTGTGVGIGTPAYMSPEQGKGAKVDSRADVYSLGVMLYEMVTGRMPYEAETPLAVVIKHITEPLPLPRSVRPDLPEEVERVILRAMAKESDDRFQTAGEMVRALDAAVRAAEAAARTEPVAARAEPAVAEVAAPLTEGPVARVRKALPAGWGRTAAWVAIGIVALVALFLILNLVPLRVQISGGQLEVVRVVEETPASTITPVSPLTPIPTLTPQPITPPAALATPLLPNPPQARAFADPILAAIADRPPDYEDDFSDPGSGWPIWPIGLTTAGDAWGYEDGAYFVSLTPLYRDPDGDCSINLRSDRAPWFSDFVLEVDAQFVSGGWGRWDAGFRQSESGTSSYLMDIFSNGDFQLHKSVNDDATTLVQGQDVSISILEEGLGTTNRLTIIAQGPWIAVYVNGELLCFAYDESLSGGRIVLGASNFADTPLRVHFDNLKVWDITDLPLPSAEAVPTATPNPIAEQAHAFAKPILAAITDRPPDYEDDFSDPGSGWPSRSTTDGDEWGYEDDAYSILVAPGYHDVSVLPDRPLELSDLVLEMDVQFVSGEWGHWYVSFRHSPGFIEQPAGAYSVKFYPDGSFDLWKNVGGISGELIEEDAVYAPSFEQRTGINRLTLIAQGPQIAIYMNGEPLWFVRDESLEKGTVMLAVGNETGSSTLRVHLDNFKVWDISGLPLSTPAP